MRETSKHDMLQLIKLVADGGVDARVGMTEQIDPPGTDSVEVAFALIVVKPHARPRAIGISGIVSCCFIWVHGCQTVFKLRSCKYLLFIYLKFTLIDHIISTR